MDIYLDLLSMLILVSAFTLVASKRISSYINTFRLQSLLLAATAGVVGFHDLVTEGVADLFLLFVITLVLKVFYIPRLLKNTFNKVVYRVEKDFFLNIPISILICCGLVVLSYFAFSAIEGIAGLHSRVYLVNSVSVMLIGLFFMISRKKAIGQIIGFLVIENGLFAAATLAARGMPIIVDLGIFVDLLTAVMIMGILVFRINEYFDSIDISELKNLRG